MTLPVDPCWRRMMIDGVMHHCVLEDGHGVDALRVDKNGVKIYGGRTPCEYRVVNLLGIMVSPEDASFLAVSPTEDGFSYRWYLVYDGKQIYAYANVERWETEDGGTTVKLHRLIMNAQPGEEVDHINGDGLDNRRENLRIATRAQNARNTGKKAGTYSSKYKGIYWHKPSGKWLAQIRTDERRISLGYFADEVDAACAYDKAALEHHGEFAHLNFPQK